MIEVEFDVIIMTFYGIILKFNLERLEKAYSRLCCYKEYSKASV